MARGASHTRSHGAEPTTPRSERDNPLEELKTAEQLSEDTPSKIAQRIKAHLEKIVEELPETDGKRKDYEGILDLFDKKMAEFSPAGHPEDKQSLEDLARTKGAEVASRAYGGFYGGMKEMLALVEDYSRRPLNKQQQAVVFEFVAVLSIDKPDKEITPESIQYGLIAGLPDKDAQAIKAEPEIAESIAHTVPVKLTPFREYKTKFEAAGADPLQIVEKENFERKAALINLIIQLEKLDPESTTREIFSDTARVEARTVTTIVTEATPERPSVPTRVDKATLKELLYKGWGEDKSVKRIDATSGDEIETPGFLVPHRNITRNYITSKDEYARTVDRKVKKVPGGVARCTFYVDRLLSEVTDTPLGTSLERDPIVHSAAVSMRFNDIQKCGLMLDSMEIPPSEKEGDDKIKIPVVDGGRRSWLVIKVSDQKKLQGEVTKTMHGFQSLGFNYDRAKAVKDALGEPEETTPRTRTTTVEVDGGGFKTDREMATDWVDVTRAGYAIVDLTLLNLDKIIAGPPHINGKKKLELEALYKDSARDFAEEFMEVSGRLGRKTSYEALALADLIAEGVNVTTPDGKKKLAERTAKYQEEYAERARGIRELHEEILLLSGADLEGEENKEAKERLTELFSDLVGNWKKKRPGMVQPELTDSIVVGTSTPLDATRPAVATTTLRPRVEPTSTEPMSTAPGETEKRGSTQEQLKAQALGEKLRGMIEQHSAGVFVYNYAQDGRPAARNIANVDTITASNIAKGYLREEGDQGGHARINIIQDPVKLAEWGLLPGHRVIAATYNLEKAADRTISGARCGIFIVIPQTGAQEQDILDELMTIKDKQAYMQTLASVGQETFTIDYGARKPKKPVRPVFEV